jgi:hypothetical protein
MMKMMKMMFGVVNIAIKNLMMRNKAYITKQNANIMTNKNFKILAIAVEGKVIMYLLVMLQNILKDII